MAREELIDTLHLLALSPEDQLRVLPPYVVVPDELALTFCDQYDLSPQSGDFGNILSEIYGRFEADSKDPFWHQESLFSDPRWQEIREMARSALELAGIAPRIPDLGWISYVPSKASSDTDPGERS